MTFGWEKLSKRKKIHKEFTRIAKKWLRHISTVPSDSAVPEICTGRPVSRKWIYLFWYVLKVTMLLIQIFSDCTDIQRMYQELSTNMWKTAYKAGVKMVKTLYTTYCAEGKINDY